MTKLLKSFVIILFLGFLSTPVLACELHGGLWGFSPAGAQTTPFTPPAELGNESQPARPSFAKPISKDVIAAAQARLAALEAADKARKAQTEAAEETDSDELPTEK